MQGARAWQSPTKYFQNAGLIKNVGPIVRGTFPGVQRGAVITSKRSTTTESGKQLIGGFKAPLLLLLLLRFSTINTHGSQTTKLTPAVAEDILACPPRPQAVQYV